MAAGSCNSAGPSSSAVASSGWATTPGTWNVGKYCSGDLFLPHEWLRFYPGPRVRHFELEGDRLTIFYPFGSGCCHELYEHLLDAPQP